MGFEDVLEVLLEFGWLSLDSTRELLELIYAVVFAGERPSCLGASILRSLLQVSTQKHCRVEFTCHLRGLDLSLSWIINSLSVERSVRHMA